MRTYGTLGLSTDGRTFQVQVEPHVAIRLKRMFGKISKKDHGTLKLSVTPETARDLEWFCERYPLDADDRARHALTANATAHRDMLLRLEQLIDPNYAAPTMQLAVPARDYQLREAAIVLAKGGLLIGDDVGLGKTASAICTFTDPRTLPAVVVTLTHLPKQWEAEIHKFAPELTVHRIKKGTPYELPQWFGRGPDVLILNYHKLSGWAQTLAAYARSIVFDEVQELRISGSQKYAAAVYVSQAMAFRTGLSATPIFNYGAEMWTVMNVLAPGALGTHSEFIQEWCGGYKGESLKDPKAFGMYLREQFLMIRHTRDEVKREIPEVVKVPHVIDSDRAALDAVEASAAELARIILARVDREHGAAWQASEQLTVLLRQATGIAKAPYVADFVRMLVASGESVVLCGWHRAVYDIWAKKLADLKPVLYTGSETATEKDAAAQAFISGTAKVLILSLRSGAGLDGLQQASSVMVFGELDWSPAVHEQCLGRLARDGQTKPVVGYFLMAEDGADPVIAEVLGLKREQSEGVVNPQRDHLERLQTDTDRVKRLAEHFLTQIGEPLEHEDERTDREAVA